MSSNLLAAMDSQIADGVLRPDPRQRRVAEKLSLLSAALEQQGGRGLRWPFRRGRSMPRGIYIWGGVGRGKSLLMEMFVRHVDITEKRRVHFHAFMREVQAALNDARKAGATDAIAPVADALSRRLRLLALDEIEIVDIADAMIVGRLFEALFDKGVVLVTTSNRAPDDLYKDGLNRHLFLPFIRLLNDRLDVVCLDGDNDYRRGPGHVDGRWFVPADNAARNALDTVWSELAGAPGAPLVLAVHGRQVRIGRAASGVARMRFWELCGQPLGPADYLALAQEIHTLILEDIPELSAANYNEARRFVMLIDVLYEGNIRLFASASVPANRLYIEGAGAFEFGRTESRLAEMQRQDWGAR